MKLKFLAQTLDEIRHENGGEYWYARDLWQPLGYKRWSFFLPVIERAKQSCEISGFVVYDHFLGVKQMVDLGSGSQREVEDFKLTRYACYLIAQNGDPRIPEIAFAQMYFAMQTRRQEVLEKNMEEIEEIVFDDKGIRTKAKKLAKLLNTNKP